MVEWQKLLVTLQWAISQSKKLEQQAKSEVDPVKQAEFRELAKTIRSKWGETGTYRVALHTLTGALTGDFSGAVTSFVTAQQYLGWMKP